MYNNDSSFKVFYRNTVIFFIISFMTISPKVYAQEVNSTIMQELLLDIIEPNKNISKNIESLEKINIKCGRELGRNVSCDFFNEQIILSKRGRSTTEVKIPRILFDIYPEDKMSMFLDAVINSIGESDYEMKSISGLVFILNFLDRSFVLSSGGLVIKSLDN